MRKSGDGIKGHDRGIGQKTEDSAAKPPKDVSKSYVSAKRIKV